CGTSGGVWGLERGYCLMIGGEADVVRRLDPLFATLAPGAGSVAPTAGRDVAAAQSGVLPVRPRHRRHRRGLASGERGRLVAPRPDGRSARDRPDAGTLQR